VGGTGDLFGTPELDLPGSQVRDLLGHASIVTTERYDNQQLERLQVAAGKLESGKLFQAPTLGSGTEFHISFTSRRRGGTVEPVTAIDGGRKLLREHAVKDRLRGRDSNPDHVVHSHSQYIRNPALVSSNAATSSCQLSTMSSRGICASTCSRSAGEPARMSIGILVVSYS
jgi:hypothetical protein